MADDDLARELEALLAVEPAPDFRSRILLRVAADRVRHRNHLAVAIAASLLVAVSAASWAVRQREPMTTAAPQLLASHRVAIATAHAPLHPVRSSPPPREARIVRPPVVPALAWSRADVLVDAREAAAWRRMLAGVRSGDVDLSRVARSRPWLAPADDEEFLLPMVIIEPLPEHSREQGVHQ